MSTDALYQSNLRSLPLLARGKVRDNYAVGDDRILMVASDRISAFDVIMGEPIPGKGELLTQMALYWFGQLGHLCPNHLTGDAPESVVTPAEVPQVQRHRHLRRRNVIEHQVQIPERPADKIRAGMVLVKGLHPEFAVQRRNVAQLRPEIRQLHFRGDTRAIAEAAVAIEGDSKRTRRTQRALNVRVVRPRER